MRKNLLDFLLLVALAAAGFLASCDDEESYAEDRKRERKQIEAFLNKGVQVKDNDGEDYLLNVPGPFRIISEEQFYANDSTTDVSKNEFVLFKGSGIYMQIVRKGVGRKLESGEAASIICRYTEFNIASDSIQTANTLASYVGTPDVMTVTNTSGTFTATFTSGVMKSYYGPSVPSGWLFPLTFINLGRQVSEDDEIALVRLIIPSTEGQSEAYSNVYACFYEISYQRGR